MISSLFLVLYSDKAVLEISFVAVATARMITAAFVLALMEPRRLSEVPPHCNNTQSKTSVAMAIAWMSVTRLLSFKRVAHNRSFVFFGGAFYNFLL
ncbi:MAG: hypothetical protein WKF87_09080 [Chryseolinea sp.]